MTLQERLTRPLLTVPPLVAPGHPAGGYTITVTAGRPKPAGSMEQGARSPAAPLPASPASPAPSSPLPAPGSPLPWLVKLRQLGHGRRN